MVERTTRFVMLTKMDNAGTRSVVDSLSAVLNRQPPELCKSMAYDQGREMHGDKILTERTGVQIYFAEHAQPMAAGLLREYQRTAVPIHAQGSDLSIYSQDELDAIALSLNTRPRETLGWKTLQAVYAEHMAPLQLQADSIH